MMTRRVAVTGLGAVTPVGLSVSESWDSLMAGRSGIAPITSLDTTEYPVKFGGEVKNLDISRLIPNRDALKLDRCTILGIFAADEALQSSGLSAETYDPRRVGVVIGSGIGGILTIEENMRIYAEKGPRRISPFVVPKMMTNAPAGQISIRYGFKGPNFSVVTACASANHAIGEAFRMVKFGFADAMVAGGTEAAISILGLGGFCSARALSTRNEDPQRASRPFDRNRDGFVLSEGSGILVLEELESARKRGATIYALVEGYGATADAIHITAPDETGAGGATALKEAILEAGWNPESVGYVNAHGTSTPLNDAVETRVIKAALGEHAYKVMISSTKSCTGHCLGAAGGVEAVFSIKALQTGVIPPTINYEDADPACDLDYVPNVAREVKSLKRAVSNSLGFGGHNSTIAFGLLD
ncbi:MAG: beta-ketoacyl-ACP synthase II [Planctomycetes bacterium]|nr:beta-ketoacyl-ACP synthase II [Planctomycetota bacterium]